MHQSRSSLGLLLGAAALLAGVSTVTSAEACGGLFCSLSNPVEQTAERIVFAVNQDETITAIIEIQYQGPAERFAWLLPMPGVPKVGVSAQEALDAIDSVTAPQYVLQYTYEGNCAVFAPEATAGGAFEDGNSVPQDGDDGITVLDQGNAGPYDYIIISADAEQPDAAQNAIDWLKDNGYDVGAAADVLAPYLDQGLNLVAFRLTKGQDVGSILPVQLTYEGTVPSVPIQPTAVAAADNMGVRVFLLGAARGVSDNYLSLTLNEARINWFNWRDGYDRVVSQAADEAGGHGFVTEFAGASSKLAKSIWRDDLSQRWSELQTFQGTGAQLMMEARFPFAEYAAFRRVVELSVNLPEGLSLDDFATDPLGYEEQYGEGIVDATAFLRGIEEQVVVPLKEAQELVDSHEYLSRLYTTISPEEMVVDPSFVFNPDLDDVSNVHTADVTIRCQEDYPWPWRITLEDGTTLEGEQQGVWFAGAESLPATVSIAAVGAAGAPEVVADNSGAIDDGIAEMPKPMTGETSDAGTSVPSTPSAMPEPVASIAPPNTGEGGSSDTATGQDDTSVDEEVEKNAAPSPSNDDSCSVAGVGRSRGATSAWLWVTLGLSAAFLRRKRVELQR